MKKQTAIALLLLLLVPVVLKLSGFVFSLVNPESAAGHPNYARNYQILSLLQRLSFFGMVAVVGIVWLLVCYLVIRAKERSAWWLCLAALGPLGFAILVMLNDRAPGEMNLYARFVRNLNWFVRVGYEVCIFVIFWELAYQAMVVKRNLMIAYESATTGVSKAQIIDLQNASSGMWAFAEGNEIIYMVVLFYLLWPIVFNLVGRLAITRALPRAAH